MLSRDKFEALIQLTYNQAKDAWDEYNGQQANQSIDGHHLEKLQTGLDEVGNIFNIQLKINDFTKRVDGARPLEEQKQQIEDNILSALNVINPNLFVATNEYDALCKQLEELKKLSIDLESPQTSADERSALISFRRSLLEILNNREANHEQKLVEVEKLENNIEKELSDESNSRKLVRSIMLGVATMLTTAAICAAIGFVAGLPTGPGAIITGVIGAISGAAMATSTIAAGSTIVGAGIAAGITTRFTLFRNKPESYAKTIRDKTLVLAKTAIEVEKPSL